MTYLIFQANNFCRKLRLSSATDLLLTEAFDIDVSPGVGYLSQSDDERCEPIENTIQLAWQPSFADEYKRLLTEADTGQAEPTSPGKEPYPCMCYLKVLILERNYK